MRSPTLVPWLKVPAISGLIFFLLLAFIKPAYSQLSVPLTVQEAIYPGAPTNGINRTLGPVTVGIPLADSPSTAEVSQLGLSGASVGQFRVLGRWPSGNIQWVLVDTQADVPAGGQSTAISLVSGSGNFGGPNLASDNGGNISINTGPAQFVIRKRNFNVFDQVVVNGRTVVSSGTSMGLVLAGPAPGQTSCGACNNLYSSSNDPNSTAIIEENGPVRAVVKVVGSHVDAMGNIYMHYTVRMHFYLGKTYAKVQVILRNADETNSISGDFISAFKGFTSYEARVALKIGASPSYQIGTDSGQVSGSLGSKDSAYLYQAYSNNMEAAAWNASNCQAGLGRSGDSRCVASFIARTPQAKHGYVYAQDGYQIVHGSIQASGDHTHYPQGWADLADASGAGVNIGVYQMSAYWPKSLQFVNGGTEARVGIWPDQSLYQGGGAIPYYQPYPQYSVHDLFFEFHATSLANPANDFLSFQHYLLARAPIQQYNTAGVFFYPLIDPNAEDAYLKSIPVNCCMLDVTPKIFRHYDWFGAGAGNQHELRWSYMRNFLERGLAGRWLHAAHFYRMQVESSFPRADGFAWRNHSLSQLNYLGEPEQIFMSNHWLGNRDWLEGQHAHWYGMPDYYFLTGDETIKDQLLDGGKDALLNAAIPVNNGRMEASRDIGERLMAIARMYQALSAWGDPDAAALLPIADNILALQVFPELNVSGYGNSPQGVSRTRGVHFGCCSTATEGLLSGRIAAPFEINILQEGLWELSQVRGPSWSNYILAQDLNYAMAEWAVTEGYRSAASAFMYYEFIDIPNLTSRFYTNPGLIQTVWFSGWVLSHYSGDLSWRPKFEAQLQRATRSEGLHMSEYGSHMVEAAISPIINPPPQTLQSIPASVHYQGNGSYMLSWTVPADVQSYRIKAVSGGKQIVDWIGFDEGTNTFIGDPVRTAPWFAGEEISAPLPTAGPTQQYLVTGLNPTLSYTFALKAYVGTQTTQQQGPTVAITAPQSGSVVSGTVTLSANATDSTGISSVTFLVDGTTIGTLWSPPYSVSWNSSQVANGKHTINVQAYDSLGKMGSAQAEISVQNFVQRNTPGISITSPASHSAIFGYVTLSATAHDPTGIAWVSFQVDGRPISRRIARPPYQAPWNASVAPPGVHTITAIAANSGGNQAVISERVIVRRNRYGTRPGFTSAHRSSVRMPLTN